MEKKGGDYIMTKKEFENQKYLKFGRKNNCFISIQEVNKVYLASLDFIYDGDEEISNYDYDFFETLSEAIEYINESEFSDIPWEY